jgi:hypothetical protein
MPGAARIGWQEHAIGSATAQAGAQADGGELMGWRSGAAPYARPAAGTGTRRVPSGFQGASRSTRFLKYSTISSI